MGWPAENLELPQKLKDAILGKNCVAFIGSGASAGVHDSWLDLVNRVCTECGSDRSVNKDSPPEDYLAAAQDALERNADAYCCTVQAHLGKPDTPIPPLYDSLIALPFRCYLTVNLDPLLAMRASRTGRKDDRLPVYSYPGLDRLKMNDRTVHYLHGIVKEKVRGQFVLAKSEFEEAYKDNSNLMTFLLPTLECDSVCFIGCRLREPTMERVFKICRDHQLARERAQLQWGHQPSKPPPKFILLPKPEITISQDSTGVPAEHFDLRRSEAEMSRQTEFYVERGIEVVWYVASAGDYSAVRRALDQLADIPDVAPYFGYGGDTDAS